jgi:seryl-tRNA synthetase
MRLRFGLALGAVVLLAGYGMTHEAHLRRTLGDERRRAQIQVEGKLAELDRKMDRLRMATRTARAQKEEASHRLQQLEQEQALLRERLREARRSGQRALEDLGRSVDRTMETIERTLGLSSEAPADDAPRAGA